MWFSSAYSRHCAATGQVLQILCALMTPKPSLGKNVSGATVRHLPSAIHTASIGFSLPRFQLYGTFWRNPQLFRDFLRGWRGAEGPEPGE